MELREITADGGSVNWADLQAVPLFATSRLVIIKSAGRLLKDQQENLAHFLKNIPETTVVVLWDDKAIDTKSTLAEALKSARQTISAAPLNNTSLSGWIEKRAKQLGLIISQEIISNIIDGCGNNLWAIENELIYLNNSNDAEKHLAKRTVLGEPFAVFNHVRNSQWSIVKKIIRDELETGMAIEMILGGVAAAVRKEVRDRSSQEEITDLLMDIDFGLKTGALDDQAAASLLIAHLPKPAPIRVQWEKIWEEINF